MRRVDTLFVGWQDSSSRRWYPVARLEATDAGFRLEYLEGAAEARREAGFPGISEFPSLNSEYESDELFSFFQNRVKPQSRPDATEEKRRLGFPNPEKNLRPFDILSRSYGRRVTDRFEIYPPPDIADGTISLLFFTRGLRHRDKKTRELWLSETHPRRPIRLKPQPDNEYDPNAQLVVDSDGRDMGYLPWYYTDSFAELVECGADYSITVERHNRDPSYPQHRFLLRFEGEKPRDWKFPQSHLYDSLAGKPHKHPAA